MIAEYLPFILFALVALGVGVAAIAVSGFLGPKRLFSKAKYEAYECGVDQLETPHKPFALKFYTFALLFILFDIETIFLLPWAVRFKALAGTGAFATVLLFLAVLGLGLFYILKTRSLDWD